MRNSRAADGPFPLTIDDLDESSIGTGVRSALAHFHGWRDSNPEVIAQHVDRYTEHLEDIWSCRRLPSLIGRWALPRRRRSDERRRFAREVNYFGVYNLGEIPDPGTLARIAQEFGGRVPSVEDLIPEIGRANCTTTLVDRLARHLPALRMVPETAWLAERLDHLYRILPEVVVQAGGMGKVIRATAGVLAIGVYDTLEDGPKVRAEHLGRILPSAYALGAAYVIIDDTLQDLPGEYISPADRQWCHRAITWGLATGKPVEVSDMPDHPMAEELHGLYELLLESHPFDEYRHLYRAAEAMYLAQHRDATRTTDEVMTSGLAAMYPDIVIKSGMSRIVANVLARRTLPDDFYARCLNTVVTGQFKDDLRDREEDLRANRLTPFTFPSHLADVNPLYDLFAYDAYVVSEVFHGDVIAADVLTWVGSVKLANHLSEDRHSAEELMRRYEVTSEIARYLQVASGMRHRVVKRLEPIDTRIKDRSGAVLSRRRQTMVDSRTFVADRLQYINDITMRYCPQAGATGLDQIIAYAMSAPGKRLRPALGLMLAEGLGVERGSIEPFVVAGELFHTASLMFDDLPAQDDAKVRRGRPTAHTVFDEGSVQLAALSMISSGFGLLSRLDGLYPPQKVTEVIRYIGTVLGPRRLCRGQDLDLHMARDSGEITGEEILEMYDLKTSTSLEAAMVPLMMVEDRPPAELELIRQYAHHAGIVFQIRDDILDLTSSTDTLGKDAGNDVGKVNIVRTHGLSAAEHLMRGHLESAVACCAQLPFDTQLLEGMVKYFAERKK
jgi:geranylgeranyl pyrophosphate synthase